jgi:GTP-binding protein
VLIDRARIFIHAGAGGNGSASFRREKFAPMGGPDGGDGGRGGDVRLVVQRNLNSLVDFQYNEKFLAEDGGAGRGSKLHGRNGKDAVIKVPPGTMVYDDATGELIADLTDEDETLVLAKGGRGGLGNVHFKTSVRQAPRIAELGEPGPEMWLRLELRLIADVGLVGLPNAGKSTLLASTSQARPKLGDYPFTTLEPNLGVVQIGGRDGQTFVMADVPGLIEGAAEGVGLGHEFLRHVTRTKAIIHVLDAAGGLEGRDPLEDFETINKELEDQGYRVFEISAATQSGVPELMKATAEILREADLTPAPQKPQMRKLYTLEGVDERLWTVTKTGDHAFLVTGIGIERTTRMTNFDLEDAANRFQRVLTNSGIADELELQGVRSGDTVTIADYELVWGDPDLEEYFGDEEPRFDDDIE